MQQQGEMIIKFRFMKNGAVTFGGGKATLAEDGIAFKEFVLPYEHIANTETRDRNMVLVLSDTSAVQGKALKYLDDDCLVVAISSPKTDLVEAAIDRRASAAEAEQNRMRLEMEGRAELYRESVCPHCQATIDLSELDHTPYIYCRFCHSLYQEGGAKADDDYRTCDECAMYDRVKGYTEFYFYFLLVVYGWSHKRRHMCDTCAGRVFIKNLLLNLLFIIGIPFAIAIKIKSLSGRNPELNDLAEANRLARKGRIMEANQLYEKLLARHRGHPGILMNQAIGYLNADRADLAVENLERAIDGCANYMPVFQLIAALQDETEPQLTE